MSSCHECGKVLMGRKDKKFCDMYCKNAHNNRVWKGKESGYQLINRVLRNNNRILKFLCPEGKTIVDKHVLDEMGYDYRNFNSFYITQTKRIYYLCYDHGFSPVREYDWGKER